MSLIMAVSVPDGMVFSSDRRITQSHSNGTTSYVDNTDKIIPCGNNAILFCGNYMINNSRKTVFSFLKKFCKDHIDTPVCILASDLLRAVADVHMKGVMFYVAGYYDGIRYIYHIACDNSTIQLPISNTQTGAVYCGQNSIVHSICADVDFETTELATAIQLAEFGVTATADAYRFKREQCVGGGTDVYVMPADEDPYWYSHAGTYYR